MKAFLVFGFGMSLMSITWIVLCFLAAKEKKKQSCERKERKVNKFVSSGPLLQIDFRYDILSFQSLAKVSTMTRTISNH
jgi:hypothetical protein